MQLRFSGNGSVRAIGMVCIVMAPASAGAQGGSWTANAPMLTAREGAVAAGVGETVYVFGGLVGNTCQGISTVEAYDAASDQWSTRAPMPTARWGAGAAVVNGIIYVIGGSVGCGPRTGAVEAYDPLTDTWTPKAPLPVPRAAAAVAAIDGIIYVAGGIDASEAILANLDIFDPAANSWQTGTPMSMPRVLAVGGALDGLFHVAAGCCAPAAATRLETYDPASGSWAVGASLSQPRVFGPAGAVLNGRFYVIGGNAGGPLHEAEAYDPATGTWAFVAPMPTARTDLSAAAAHGRIYAMGGDLTGGDHVTGTNEAFEPDAAPPADTTPPLAALHASPGVLWPPNHELVQVTAILEATDDSGSVIVDGPFVMSSEAIEGTGDGDSSPDWIIDATYQIRLRAERSGPGRGRVYTIKYVVKDPSGNATTVAVTVNVPHGGR